MVLIRFLGKNNEKNQNDGDRVFFLGQTGNFGQKHDFWPFGGHSMLNFSFPLAASDQMEVVFESFLNKNSDNIKGSLQNWPYEIFLTHWMSNLHEKYEKFTFSEKLCKKQNDQFG